MKPWLACSVEQLPGLHYVGAAAGAVCLPLQFVGTDGYQDNITDWALKQFRDRYTSSKGIPLQPSPSLAAKGREQVARRITKPDSFHYVYAVLHDPVYCETYAQNLKREFPRIPFYENFWQWAAWGVMTFHLL